MPNHDSVQRSARSRVIRRRTTHPMRFLMKRHAYLAVAALLLVFLGSTVWVLLHLQSIATIQQGENALLPTAVAERIDLARIHLGTVEITCCVYGGLGFLGALVLFAHLFSRRQAMLVAALPVDPVMDFAQRTACFVVYAMLPTLFSFLCILVTIFANGLAGLCAWPKLLAQMGVLLAIELYGYALGALCCVLTGKLWAAILGGAVIGLSAEGTVGLVALHAESFLYTLNSRSFIRSALRFSPVYTLYKNFYRPGVVGILPGLVAIVLFLVLGVWLYRVRRVERAESTLVFPILEIALSVYLPIIGGLFIGMIFYTSEGGEALTIAASVFGALLTWALCELLFSMRLKGILRCPALALAPAAVLLAMFGALHTDVMGFDSYLPNASELTAITIQARTGTGYEDEILLRDSDAVAYGREWAEHMRDYAVKQRGFGENRGTSVTVTYHLRNRDVQRVYTLLNGPREQTAIRSILNSEDYRESLLRDSALVSLRAAIEGGVIKHEGANAMIDLALWSDDSYLMSLGLSVRDFSSALNNSADMLRLLDAYALDVRSRTADDIQSGIIGMIDLYGMADNQYFSKGFVLCASDTNMLKLFFGERAEKLIQYNRLGFVEAPGLLFFRLRKEGRIVESISEPLTMDDVRQLLRSGVLFGNQAQMHYAHAPILENEYLAALSKTQMQYGEVAFEKDSEYRDWILENGTAMLNLMPIKQ